MINKIIFFIIFLLLVPTSYSNGGCTKIADDIFVQLSSAPLAPLVNEQASFLISFFNGTGIIQKPITGNISLVKDEERFLVEDFSMNNGVLEMNYTFVEEGFYELFVVFAMNNKTYQPEDFFIRVIGPKQSFLIPLSFLIMGFLLGVGFMKLKKNL